MNTKQIKDKEKTLGIIVYGNKIVDGLKFYTKDTDFIQVATWKYKKGKASVPHTHKIHTRQANITQEVVIVKEGSLKISFFNNKELIIAEETINKGDFAILLSGGHSYETLQNNTEVYEIKNGPYPGIEKDKKVIQNV